MFNINPRQMQKMMQQMGMKSTNINAKEVRIICNDGIIIIENPSIQKISIQGHTSFQITGNEKKINNSELNQNADEEISFSDDDIKMVVEQTGKPKEEVKKVLEKTKDIAKAIMELNANK